MNVVRSLSEIKEPKVSELGGKGHSLAILINNGFNVPKGFVIVSNAFFEYLKQNNLMSKIEKLASEINENNFPKKSKKIKRLILKGKMPEEIASEIKEYLNQLNVQRVSIRSSAVSEDSLKASFAGLHDTFLNIKANSDLVSEYVTKCWASLFNERAIFYRIKKKIHHLEGIGVIIQEMIDADISGTTFTAHPDSGDRNIIVIEASYGLGEAIVSGLLTPDRYIIDKNNKAIVERVLGRKKITVKPDENGTSRVDTSNDKMNTFCLNDTLIESLASKCLNIEKLFEYPQDIEWCIHKNKIWILQSRSITSLEVNK